MVRCMTTNRFAIVSTSPFVATFRTVKSERVARLFVRLYTRLGYVSIHGTPLRFAYTAVA